MGTICVSSAPILRCVGLTRLEAAIILIPPGLGTIFAILLVVIKWGKGWKHLLLAAEGVLYFLVAGLDFISHFLSPITNSATRFKAFDIVVGATSGIPLLLYIAFLFTFLSSDVIPDIPKRFQRIARYLLLVFIPTVIFLNEISSFIGISYRSIPSPDAPATVVVGFKNQAANTEWAFFSSLSLALITAYQAICFMLAFFRLMKAFISQRRIETRGESDDESILFRGIGWIALGIKLGAIETVIGFAQAGFSEAIIRRIVRLLGRACLIIGVVKGLDVRENFQILDAQIRSDLKGRIGLPDPRTFQHIGAEPKMEEIENEKHVSMVMDIQRRMRESVYNPLSHASTVRTARTSMPHSLQTGDDMSDEHQLLKNLGPGYLTMAPVSRKPSATSTAKTNLSTYSVASRVTVHFEMGKAPTLDVRFSALDLPSPSEFTSKAESSLKSRPQSEWIVSHSRVQRPVVPHIGHPYANPELWFGSGLKEGSPVSAAPFSNLVPLPVSQPPALFRTNTYAGEKVTDLLVERRRRAFGSGQSFGSNTSADLEDLTKHFPTLPLPVAQHETRMLDPEMGLADVSVSRQSSWSGKSRRTIASGRSIRSKSPFTNPAPVKTANRTTFGEQEIVINPKSGAIPSSGMVQTEFDIAPPAQAMVTPPATPPASNNINLPRFDMPQRPAPVGRQRPSGPRTRNGSQDSTSSAEYGVLDVRVRPRLASSPRGSVRSPAQVDRVKSYGNAPLRNTPTPTSTSFSRDSIPIEHIEFEVPAPHGSLVGTSNSYGEGLPRSVGSSLQGGSTLTPR